MEMRPGNGQMRLKEYSAKTLFDHTYNHRRVRVTVRVKVRVRM